MSSSTAIEREAARTGGWRAELKLRFGLASGGATRLLDRQHIGPLVVQRPFYPEGDTVPHVYVLHPPGGLVGGDALRLAVTVEARAHALLTTPAATKVYRSAGPRATQHLSFTVGPAATLEWLPQETIFHDGAHAEIAAEIHLAEGARFIGLDTSCFGLPARGETFATGRFRQRFEIWRGDRPIFVERGRFDAPDAVHQAAWGLAGARVNGLFVVAPAPMKALTGDELDSVRSLASEIARPAWAAITVLGDGEVLVGRYVGPSAERARLFFQQLWTLLRPPLTGRPALAPRIWAT